MLGDDGHHLVGVSRPVVDHDDLESAASLLALERREAEGESSGAIAGGHDDAEPKLLTHRHGAACQARAQASRFGGVVAVDPLTPEAFR
jgi:hypothetical protein